MLLTMMAEMGLINGSGNLIITGTSHLKNPMAYFNSFGPKQITLSVSNGVCSDTVTKPFLLAIP